MKTIFSFFFFLLLSSVLGAQDFKEIYDRTDYVEKRPGLVVGDASSIRWIDGDHVVYRTRSRDGKDVTWILDSRTGEKKAVSPKELESRTKGSGSERTGRKERGVRSPDGQYLAYVENSNVWLEDRTGKTWQLSYDAEYKDRNGDSKMYYAGIYWSPDSRKLVSMKVQDVVRRQIPIIESSPEGQLQPALTLYDYVKPGDRLPVSVPVLFDVEKKSRVESDMTPYSDRQFSLHFTRWNSDSRSFLFEFNQRGHQLYQIVSVDAATGAQKIIVNETSRTFIHYSYKTLRFLQNDDLIWASQRDGWRHLYRISSDGSEIRQLTKGEWVVRNIQHIDEENGKIYFTANGRNSQSGPYAESYYERFSRTGVSKGGEDPYNLHLLRLDLNTLEIADLTPEYANHNLIFNADKNCFVDRYSRPDLPPVTVLRSLPEGRVIAEMGRADIRALKAQGWTAPEVFVSKARDGRTDIWGTIHKPAHFNPDKKYPVVEYIYAGPHDSFAPKDFSAYSRFDRLTELGFIVVCLDGMGTSNRSKAFHDVCWRNLKDAGFPDRILWMKDAASTRKYMDLSKVGIYGYSAGGQSTLSALLNYGGFYKVGVALCGCHDNRMDKIWWNEQWMGYPIGKWYSENSNVDNAHKLEGELFIINGEMDTNVDPASTLQVVKALVKADKDFDQLYMPGYGHNLGDRYVTRRVFGFFWERILQRMK